jgi:hypothetical protein
VGERETLGNERVSSHHYCIADGQTVQSQGSYLEACICMGDKG